MSAYSRQKNDVSDAYKRLNHVSAQRERNLDLNRFHRPNRKVSKLDYACVKIRQITYSVIIVETWLYLPQYILV